MYLIAASQAGAHGKASNGSTSKTWIIMLSSNTLRHGSGALYLFKNRCLNVMSNPSYCPGFIRNYSNWRFFLYAMICTIFVRTGWTWSPLYCAMGTMFGFVQVETPPTLQQVCQRAWYLSLSNLNSMNLVWFLTLSCFRPFCALSMRSVPMSYTPSQSNQTSISH